MGYTLSQITEELLLEMGEGQGGNKFARLYQFGLSFLRQKHFTTTGFPKVVELTINDNDTANLPNDYVQYTKIAYCVNGQLYSLGLDNGLCLNPTYNDCGERVATPGTSTDVPNQAFWWDGYATNRVGDHYRNGENMGRFFGIGGDNNSLGYYRIDKTNNIIVFSSLAQTGTIVLEYLADVSAVDEDFDVHPFCVEALKNYVFWMYKFRSNKPLGEIDLARDIYKKSFNLMQRMFRSNTADEWIAAFQSGNSATPKL